MDYGCRRRKNRFACEAGNVRLVRAAWNGPYIEELAAFPNHRYKDQVDASSGAFNKLAAMQLTAAPLPLVETFAFGAAAAGDDDPAWVPRIVG